MIKMILSLVLIVALVVASIVVFGLALEIEDEESIAIASMEGS